MLEGVHVPESVVVVLDVDDIRIEVKRQGAVLERDRLAALALIDDLGALVDGFDVAPQQGAGGVLRAAVADDDIAVAHLLVHHRTHVGDVGGEARRIDGGQDLDQRPEIRHAADQGVADDLRAVVFNEDLVGMVDGVQLPHLLRRQLRGGVQELDEAAVGVQELIRVFDFPLFQTEDQRAVDAVHEVGVIQCLLDQRGLAAVQEAGEQIYRCRHLTSLQTAPSSLPHRRARR